MDRNTRLVVSSIILKTSIKYKDLDIYNSQKSTLLDLEKDNPFCVNQFIRWNAIEKLLKEIYIKYPEEVLYSENITDEILMILMSHSNISISKAAKKIYYKLLD